jgi:hypothetical protein
MKRPALTASSKFSVFHLLLVFATGYAVTAQAEDKSLFKSLAEDYNSSPQTTIHFRHILSSEFFGTSDTVVGSIVFAADGRYVTELGPDVYLFDGSCLWEYSKLYAQASRNCLKPGQRLDDSFLFFRHFNEYYQVKVIQPDSVYQLAILEDFKGRAPDSMTVTLSPSVRRIISMEYYDINEELNRILLGDESKVDTVDSLLFVPGFPDSTEIIEIPG